MLEHCPGCLLVVFNTNAGSFCARSAAVTHYKVCYSVSDILSLENNIVILLRINVVVPVGKRQLVPFGSCTTMYPSTSGLVELILLSFRSPSANRA